MSLVVRRYRDKGRGVYSTLPLRKGDLVEVAPVIVFTEAEWKPMLQTRLESYAFEWGRGGKDRAMPLGYGGLFNHSDVPNLNFKLNRKTHSITFRAKRDIPAGEQLTIDYGWTKDDKRRWFKR